MTDVNYLPPRSLPERICAACGERFTPKPSGYNAKYCSAGCKATASARRNRLNGPKNPAAKRAARARSYQQTKAHADRYSRHLASGRATRTAAREWLADYKMKSGCVDCGYKGHFSALQLDHEGKKSIEIADARSSIARLMKEIEDGNCKVRCANCHSIRTWERKQIPSPEQCT